jgi:aspartyl/asparaginyl beta-hydroxylase (cupin superfamily)
MKNTIYFIVILLILSCKLKKENIEITNNDKLINSIDSIINANFSSTEPGAAIIITKKR